MAIMAPLHAGKGLPPRTGRWALTAAVLASGMTLIDETALNLALPAIQAGLGASGAGLLWVANAYALCLGTTSCCLRQEIPRAPATVSRLPARSPRKNEGLRS